MKTRWMQALCLFTISCLIGKAATHRLAPKNQEKTLKLGIGAEPWSLDPHKATSLAGAKIMLALFEGLASEHPKTLEPVPGVAKSWKVSKDGKTYEFHLRKEARWSNGDPVRADDFVYSYRRMLNPSLANQYAYMLYPMRNARLFHEGLKCADGFWLFDRRSGDPERIAHPLEWNKMGDIGKRLAKDAMKKDRVCPFCRKNMKPLNWQDWDAAKVGVDAVNNQTLRITLERPLPYFTRLLAHYSWYPVHFQTVERFGERVGRAIDGPRRDLQWTRPGNLVGNGPFTLEEWTHDRRIVVKRNPLYWEAQAVRLSQIQFHFIENLAEEIEAYEKGLLHVTQTLPPKRMDEFREKRPKEVVLHPYWGSYFYRLNVNKKPLDDVRIRRALALAIDRRFLVEKKLMAVPTPAYHLCPPNPHGFQSKAQFRHDLKMAKALVAEYLKEQNLEKMPPIELIYNISESHRIVAESIQAMWRGIGIETHLKVCEWRDFLGIIEKEDYQVSRAGWIGDYLDPNTFMDMWVTDGGHNNTGWSNARYDQLIVLAGKTNEKIKRMEIFHSAEKILADEVPVIPIYFYGRPYLKHPTVQGWHPNVLDRHPYKHVHLGGKANRQ